MTKIQKKFNDYIIASAELVKHLNESDYEVEGFDEETDRLNDVIDNLGGELSGEYNDFSIYNDKNGKMTMDNLELDDYIKSIIGKDYFFDRRCWSYLHDCIVEIMNYMPILDENIIYEDVELDKDYIVEGIFLKKGTKIKIEEETLSPLVGTFTDDSDGKLVDFNMSDIEALSVGLVQHLKEVGYLNEDEDNYLENYDKLMNFCLTSYQKLFKMPTFNEVEDFAKQSFNKPTVIDNKYLG